ncbi:MAG TPA: methylcobamide--CoM methyltransferase, partial [Firmicutes bacterium]|nr:methylcobamide--CoM methyltransferase [Bacillota bacterium]
MREALTREQVAMAVERRGCEGIPVMMGKWWGNGLVDKYGNALLDMAKEYPDDICELWYMEPGFDKSPNSNPEYRMGYRNDYSQFETHSIGESVVLLPDWDELDQFLEHFPDPNEPGNFDWVYDQVKKANGRYTIGCWWRLFHERFWAIRGMENLMMDYYDNMDGLKKLGHKLIEFYKVIIDR